MIKSFTTHKRDVVKGKRLEDALHKVADDWRKLAHAIYDENAYASHVSEETKLQDRQDMLHQADEIEGGIIRSVTIAQRINTELTGECVALLP